MEYGLKTLAFLLLCLSPIPTYVVLTSGIPSHNRLYRALLFNSYWILFLTSIALILGYIGALSRFGMAIAMLMSYLPLLSRHHRAGSIKSVYESYLITIKILSTNRILGIATLGLALVFLYSITTTTTTDYDSMSYHLPFLYDWLLNHKFTIYPQFANTIISYYPSNWEALCALFALTFYSDFLLLFPNLMALLLFVNGIIGVGLYLNIAPRTSWSAALLLCTTPTIFENMLSLHIDIPLAAFFFSALFFGLNLKDMPTRETVVALALSLAVMMGIKTSGLAYAALACLLVILAWPGALRVVFGHLLTKTGFFTVLMFVLLGGSWYLRNQFYAQTPIGPLKATSNILQTTLLEVMVWSSPADYRALGNALIIQFGLPFVVLSALTLLFVGFARVSLKSRIYVSIAMLLALCLYVIMPFSGDNGGNNWKVATEYVGNGFRYGYPFFGLLTLAMALVFSQSLALSRAFELGTFISCAIKLAAIPQVWTTLLIVLIGFAVLGRWGQNRHPFRWQSGSALTVSILGLILLSGLLMVLEQQRLKNRPKYMSDIYNLLKDRSITKITYTDSHQSFLWYGDKFDVTVSYVDENALGNLVPFMEAQGAQALAIGPNIVSKHDAEIIYANLLNDGRFRLLYGDFLAGQPAVFEFQRSGNGSNPLP